MEWITQAQQQEALVKATTAKNRNLTLKTNKHNHFGI